MKTMALRLTSFVVAALLAGCPTGSDVAIHSSAPSINFGNVTIGQTVTRDFAIRAVTAAGARATITGVTSSNPLVSVREVTLSRPDFDKAYTVTYRPTAEGPLSASLHVVAQNETGREYQLDLAVTGAGIRAEAPALTLSDSRINLGNIVVGRSASGHLILSNTGTAPLTFTATLDTSPLSSGRITILDSSDPYALTGVIAVRAATSITLQATPDSAGFIESTLNIESDGGSASVRVFANAVDGAVLALSPATLNFGSVTIDSSGRARGSAVVTVTNRGSLPLVVNSAVAMDWPFEVTGSVSSIAPSMSQSLEVSIDANAAGEYRSILTVMSNGGVESINLLANVYSPVISVSRRTLNFGAVFVGETTSQRVIVSNTGTAPLTISSVTFLSITGAFSIRGALPSTISPGSSAPVDIEFTPPFDGSYTDTLSIETDGGNALIRLSGRGINLGGLEADATFLDLGPIGLIPSPSGPVATGASTVIIRNTGTSSLTITNAVVSGEGFSLSSAVPALLSPGDISLVSIGFTANATGFYTGLLTIESTAGDLNIMLAASVQAPALTISPSLLDFGTQTPGTTTTLPLTFENTGSSLLTLDSVTLYGGSAFRLPVLPFSSLIPGERRTVGITFQPLTAGRQSAFLSVFTDAGETNVSISGSGAGVTAVHATPDLLNFDRVRVGAVATFTVTVTNTSAATITISGLRTSESALTTRGLTSSVLSPGTSASFQVDWTPTAIGSLNGTITVDTTAGSLVIYALGTGAP